MPPNIPPARLSCTPAALTLRWADGREGGFDALWLADNDPRHRDAHSGQRLIDVADLPEAPLIREATLEGRTVLVAWQDDAVPAARFDLDWLASQLRRREAPGERPRAWAEGAAMDGRRDCAWIAPAQLGGSGADAAAWFERLIADGLAFLSGVPAEPGAILDAASQVGIVLETNYGRLFDVRSVARAENLAYTDLGLGLHTDNPYREPVPGYQVLHCLVAAPDGGDSLFADGFAIAARLRDEDPQAFAMLAGTPVPFAYRSADADLEARRPLIELDAGGDVVAVSYNNRSIEPLPLTGTKLGDFYRAYRRLAALLREPAFQLRLRLEAGELVVFDNRRILHARTSYQAARHLQGCYLTRDSVRSRLAVLRRAARSAEEGP